ncbi:MAG: GPR endopeptidase [Ruminococcaceae bacterium]|nr:GPR endopeptidase [Oscillospiraceae bacterium]
MNTIRSDLAIEICKNFSENEQALPGIECTRERRGSLNLETVTISTPEGASLVSKPIGKYVTIDCGRLWMEHRDKIKQKLLDFCDLLRPMITPQSKGSILVAGLGNESITADAIGPIAVKNLIVTRHIRRERPQIFDDLGLCEVCAMTPGVLGQTGIESADMIRSVVEQVKPQLLVVIDALASRELSHLVNTIQIANSGISPGSGIGNRRPALSPRPWEFPLFPSEFPP